MPSPFPGMNPYFERPGQWRGIHTSLLAHLQSEIAAVLPPRYFVDIEESLYLDVPGLENYPLFAVADIKVSDTFEMESDEGEGGTAVAVAAPATAVLPVPEATPTKNLAVRDRNTDTIVTVIELLSPTNKATGKGRDQYLQKRGEILVSDTSFVEIDLLRGGPRMPIAPPSRGVYSVIVSRWTERPNAAVWAFGLRDPLPTLPIPLRPGEAEPSISLKPPLDRVYDGGRYGNRIYRHEPEPPLSAADLEWAKALLPAVEA